MLRATAACHFGTSVLQKMARECGVLHILTYKCTSRHSGVQFFRIGTSKIGPPLVFVHFELKICFAPQRRAIFEHRNFKNCSDRLVFCAFWLENGFRATAAYHFLTSELAKSVPPWGVLYILTWKCASRHSGVPFFICLLNSYLRTRCFSEATFWTSRTTNHWENTAIREFPDIWRMWIFFLVTLLACWSSFCWLDISTLLFNSANCRKLDLNFFRVSFIKLYCDF